jgi:hypothetical protein
MKRLVVGALSVTLPLLGLVVAAPAQAATYTNVIRYGPYTIPAAASMTEPGMIHNPAQTRCGPALPGLLHHVVHARSGV